jgi:DNA-binding response OmpR family regulator
LGGQHQLLFREGTVGLAEVYHSFSPELVIIDLHLSEGDGFGAYAELASSQNENVVPAFFVSASRDVEAKLKALSLGAADFIIKPFHPTELRLKIENSLRRNEKVVTEKSFISHGPIGLDPGKFLLKVENHKQIDSYNLTQIEVKLLKFFIDNKEKVLSRTQILDGVWGNEVHVVDRVVDNQVSALRKKSSILAACLKSIYGSGYIFSLLKKAA